MTTTINLTQKDVGKNFKTRDGDKVLILQTREGSTSYPFAAYHYKDDELLSYTKDGRYDEDDEDGNDIVAVWTEPKKVDMTINVDFAEKCVIVNPPKGWYVEQSSIKKGTEVRIYDDSKAHIMN